MTNIDFINETYQKIQAIDMKAKEEFEALLQQGLLSQMDYRKVKIEVEASKQAVIRALQNQDYKPEMQVELVNRLLERYQESLFKSIQEIKNRQYTDENVETRIALVEHDAVTTMKRSLDKGIISKQVWREFDRYIQRERKKLITSINGIPKKHPRRGDMIEQWLKEYGSLLQNTVSQYSPKLTSPQSHGTIRITKDDISGTTSNDNSNTDEIIEGEFEELPSQESNQVGSKKKNQGFWSKLFG